MRSRRACTIAEKDAMISIYLRESHITKSERGSSNQNTRMAFAQGGSGAPAKAPSTECTAPMQRNRRHCCALCAKGRIHSVLSELGITRGLPFPPADLPRDHAVSSSNQSSVPLRSDE
jgi:hypothetical protein